MPVDNESEIRSMIAFAAGLKGVRPKKAPLSLVEEIANFRERRSRTFIDEPMDMVLSKMWETLKAAGRNMPTAKDFEDSARSLGLSTEKKGEESGAAAAPV